MRRAVSVTVSVTAEWVEVGVGEEREEGGG